MLTVLISHFMSAKDADNCFYNNIIYFTIPALTSKYIKPKIPLPFNCYFIEDLEFVVITLWLEVYMRHSEKDLRGSQD